MLMHPQKEEMLARINTEVPRKPGVYIFKDEKGKIIYIGKSVNLRQRIASYFRPPSANVETRIKRMIFSIRDFTFNVTDSELAALLLEDKLIKKHFPMYNIRQKEFPYYQYLLLTRDEYPCLKMIDSSVDYGNQQIFGPFRDKYFAGSVLEIVQTCFHLRACTDPDPVQKCIRREIESCTGPCTGEVSPKEYAEKLSQAVAFLKGEENKTVEKMKKTMEECAASMHFEKAERIKERIAFIQKFCTRQKFIQRFMNEAFILHEDNEVSLTHIFINGDHSTRKSRLSKKQVNQLKFKPLQSIPKSNVNDRYLLDQANIVYNWMLKNEGSYDSAFMGEESTSEE